MPDGLLPKLVKSPKAPLILWLSYPSEISRKDVPIDIKMLLLTIMGESILQKVPKPVPRSLTRKLLS